MSPGTPTPAKNGNWVTQHKALTAVAVLVVLVIIGTVSGKKAAPIRSAAPGALASVSTTPAPQTVTVTQTPTAAVTPTPPPSSSAPAPIPSAASTQPVAPASPVPNVVCLDLQSAQDTMQAAGYYVLRSQDGTGRGRFQVLDRNWTVTAQSPKPGKAVVASTEVMLTAVKIGEPTGKARC